MATLGRNAAVHETTVIERRVLAPGVVAVSLDAPKLANATRPGQYVMAIPPSEQTAATALAVFEAEGKLASLLFFVTGKRTRELSELRSGDRLDVVGPLGNGFDCSTGVRDVAIVAGGVGIASLLLCAQSLVRAGAAVRLYYGARTADLLVEAQRFVDAGCELIVTTDDGTQREARLHHRGARASRKSRANFCLRSDTDAARRRSHRAGTWRSGAAFARRDFWMRRRRLLGMCRARHPGERASAEFSTGASGWQRRRLRAHLS